LKNKASGAGVNIGEGILHTNQGYPDDECQAVKDFPQDNFSTDVHE